MRCPGRVLLTSAVAQGYFALRALDPVNGAVTDDTAHLLFRTRRVFARVDNFNYQAAYRLGIFNRELFHWDPEAAIDETNTPEVETELVYLQIGRASLITIPACNIPALTGVLFVPWKTPSSQQNPPSI